MLQSQGILGAKVPIKGEHLSGGGLEEAREGPEFENSSVLEGPIGGLDQASAFAAASGGQRC